MKRKGKKRGRKVGTLKSTKEKYPRVIKLYDSDDEISLDEALKIIGLSKTAFYKREREIEEERERYKNESFLKPDRRKY